MAPRSCCQCGEPSPLGYDLCDSCDRAIGTEWPVSLGLAIRRFARVCEVRQLQEDICMGVYAIALADRAYGAGERRDDKDGGELFRTALSRLAALAMEVEP